MPLRADIPAAYDDVTLPCHDCGGEGRRYDATCSDCLGLGQLVLRVTWARGYWWCCQADEAGRFVPGCRIGYAESEGDASEGMGACLDWYESDARFDSDVLAAAGCSL